MKKSLINAIKNLLTKLGAQELEGNNLVEVINNGADAIEGGGGSGGALVVHDTNDTLDKTFAEIKTAMNTSVIVLYRDNTAYYLVSAYKEDSGNGRFVKFKSFDELAKITFKTTEDNGYPVFTP